MSTNKAIAEAIKNLADDLDDQRSDSERRHDELMEQLKGIRFAVGHWVDNHNETRSHVEEQFRREAEERRKLGSRIGALELATAQGGE
jgi:hypothetical protein